MKTLISFPFIALLLLFSACKKEDKPTPKQSMSFKMNGTEYQFDVTQFAGGSNATGSFRIVSAKNWGTQLGQPTDFPYWFDIRKASTGAICATLMPKEFPIPYIDSLGNCNFKVPTVDQNGNPLSPDKVFYYQSGTINYSKSDCGNRSYFDIYCLCTQTGNACDLYGSFELTFRNGLNEVVQLTDGKLTIPNNFQ